MKEKSYEQNAGIFQSYVHAGADPSDRRSSHCSGKCIYKRKTDRDPSIPG